MKILVYEGKNKISEHKLEGGKTYKVGRKDHCDILLEKRPGISREHFEIFQNEHSTWEIKVLSEVMPITIRGESQNQFTLEGSGEFSLPPYRFQFDTNASSPVAANEPSSGSIFENQGVEPPKNNETEKSEVDDENTAAFQFNGVPYIKIIGQQGKKSEYFRLEGNLWVIGGHESASVHINEAKAEQNHFEISKTDKGFFVSDSGSSLGTELNGQKLTPRKPSRIFSGDILTVGLTSLQFELRDKSFQRKVNNIPLNLYKNPLVFFEQDVAMVSFAEENQQAGQVEELKLKNSQPNKENKMRAPLIAVAVLLLAFAAKTFLVETPDPEKTVTTSDPFSQLSPAEQKIVVQTHNLAKKLYLDGNFELALVQLDKLHSIIPVYKDSQEMEDYCINSRDLKRQQAAIEEQKREQERLERKVISYIAQCNQRFANSQDIEGVQACLAPALDLDPNNPAISQLISDVTAREEAAKIRKKIAQERADKVRRGKELYETARRFHKASNYFKAIEAYENHIHSGLPDPKKLVKKSKRNLATIESQIRSKKDKLFGQAQSDYKSKKLREAIEMGRKAQRVDPYDPQISSFLFNTEKELKNKMKGIYLDSVIEERFGNLEASRVKWEQILKTDISDGEYYLKAKRKLKQYGYKN